MVGFLTAPDAGISALIAQLANDTGVTLAPVPPASIVNQNVPFALAEKAQAVKYPAMYVYTDRVRNLLKEKFRAFSGKVRTVAEVRVSQDRIEGMEEQLRLYVDSVTQVLDANRGSWGAGCVLRGRVRGRLRPGAARRAGTTCKSPRSALKWIFRNEKGNGRLFLWDVTYRPITSEFTWRWNRRTARCRRSRRQNRIPLMNLGAKQIPVATGRKDKTGSRTFAGLPNNIRRDDEFSIEHVDDGVDGSDGRSDAGPAVSSGAGRDAASLYGRNGGVASRARRRFNSRRPHGLTPGQAMTSGDGIRFVAAVENSTTVFINAPFTITPTAGAAIGADDDLLAGGGLCRA